MYWDWYEDYQPHLYYHKNKTKKEFKADVKLLLKKYGKEYLEQESSWANIPGWIDYIDNKLPELGYEQVKEVMVGFFGGYILGDDYSDFEEPGDEDVSWGKIVGKRLLKQAMEHNKKFNKEIKAARKPKKTVRTKKKLDKPKKK